MIIECIVEPSSLFALLAFVAACFLAAIPGAVFRPGGWYERLVKPRWRAPNWLFAPIWTVLYLTIAISGWLVWREAGIAGAALPLAIFALQLVLNVAWTPLSSGCTVLISPSSTLWSSGCRSSPPSFSFTRSTPEQPWCSYHTWHGSHLPPRSTSLFGASIRRQERCSK